MSKFITIIRPDFMQFCKDACRAAAFNHLLFRIAGKSKDAPQEKIISGDILWYAKNEQIVEEMSNAWGLCKVRQEVNALIGMGLIGRKNNPAWGADRTKHFCFGEKECRKFLEYCEMHQLCVVHLELPNEVKHLIYSSNANDKSIKCICLNHQMETIDVSNANDESIKAIPIDRHTIDNYKDIHKEEGVGSGEPTAPTENVTHFHEWKEKTDKHKAVSSHSQLNIRNDTKGQTNGNNSTIQHPRGSVHPAHGDISGASGDQDRATSIEHEAQPLEKGQTHDRDDSSGDRSNQPGDASDKRGSGVPAHGDIGTREQVGGAERAALVQQGHELEHDAHIGPHSDGAPVQHTAGSAVVSADLPGAVRDPHSNTARTGGVSLTATRDATPVRRSGSPSTGTPASPDAAQAKRKGKKTVPDIQPVPKCDTREIQKRINEHRGYALEEDTEIIRERKAIKTWCNLHPLEEYSQVMQGLKKDKYWGKDENYYRIGGLILLKETPGILAKRNHYPLKAVANGDVAPQEEDDDYSDFDIYKGNGKEERAKMRELYEVMKANGELI